MPNRKLPPDEKLIELYEAGNSTGEIAEMFDAAPVTVCSAFRRIGYGLRSSKEASRLAEQRGRLKRTAYWEGKKQPKEMVERRVSKIRGENHYLWKGGKSRRGYRGKVVKEKCAGCGGKLNLGIHHIDFDHYNNNPENLKVLCVSCHMSLHKKAYWDAYRNGERAPRGNGPIGWNRGGDEGGSVLEQ